MKVPLNWLKDYVDIDVDARTLAERLTFAGLEVESIETDGAGETVLSLEITPNRPDLLGLLGIAREAAALFGKKLKRPEFDLTNIGGEDGHAQARLQQKEVISVIVDDSAGCPRYVARALANITVGPSPDWMRRRLALAGIGSINNVVDITNYVLLECGQPLHAFDLNLIKDGKIIVRRAKDGETITTLDDMKRKLSRDILVIADAVHPVAIAGIMGGVETGIQPTTTSVLLESACFQPALIRRASKSLELASESSYRFERGVDINGVDFAGRRACALLAEICGARPVGGAIDIFPAKPPGKKIACRYSRADALLGVKIPPERVKAIFNSLDLPVIAESAAQCTVRIKTFRPDLETEADLIEELARINGLDRIPARDPFCRVIASVDDRPSRALAHCRNIFAALGLREIVNYSFVSEKLLNLFDDKQIEQRIVIPRPVSAEYSVLRDSLLPQMTETLGRNLARAAEEAALFEIGRVFFKTRTSAFHEETRAALGLLGPVGRPTLQKRGAVTEMEIFCWLKGILRNFFGKLSCSGANLLTIGEISGSQPPAPPFCFPVSCFKANRTASISLNGKICGIMGLLKDELRRAGRILEPLALAEIALEPFLKDAFKTPAAAPLPVYPSVKRDMALRVPAALRHEEIIKIIRKNSPKELTAAVLFDIYKDKETGSAFKSMAYGLTYRSLDRTLTDEEVNKLHESVKKRLKDELKIEIREG